jgi:hypothetical protein
MFETYPIPMWFVGFCILVAYIGGLLMGRWLKWIRAEEGRDEFLARLGREGTTPLPSRISLSGGEEASSYFLVADAGCDGFQDRG